MTSFHEAQVLHTLGWLVGRQKGRERDAEELLRTSLELAEEQGMPHFHEARVLHTLGKLVGRQETREPEARKMMEMSLDIGRLLGQTGHQAQVLYSLATLPDVPPGDARPLLEESLRTQSVDERPATGEDRALRPGEAATAAGVRKTPGRKARATIIAHDRARSASARVSV